MKVRRHSIISDTSVAFASPQPRLVIRLVAIANTLLALSTLSNIIPFSAILLVALLASALFFFLPLSPMDGLLWWLAFSFGIAFQIALVEMDVLQYEKLVGALSSQPSTYFLESVVLLLYALPFVMMLYSYIFAAAAVSLRHALPRRRRPTGHGRRAESPSLFRNGRWRW